MPRGPSRWETGASFATRRRRCRCRCRSGSVRSRRESAGGWDRPGAANRGQTWASATGGLLIFLRFAVACGWLWSSRSHWYSLVACLLRSLLLPPAVDHRIARSSHTIGAVKVEATTKWNQLLRRNAQLQLAWRQSAQGLPVEVHQAVHHLPFAEKLQTSLLHEPGNCVHGEALALRSMT